MCSLCAGCADGAAQTQRDPKPQASPPGAGGEAGAAAADEAAPSSLEFLEGPASLAPRQALSLTVRADPPGPFKVRFTLPTDDASAPLDAVLDGSVSTTDANGEARVLLTAPSTGTSFVVRASIGDLATIRELLVVDTGSTSVLVKPAYSGRRPIESWVASARPNETCASATGLVPSDGTVTAPAVGRDEEPLIRDVPAGVPLAIVLRSGHFVSGCASVEMLPAGLEDRPSSVEVTVLDRPIDLTQTKLAVSFGLATPGAAWGNLLTSSTEAIQASLLAGSVDDPEALLEAMWTSASASQRPGLDAARQAEGWDNLVRARWGGGASTHLRSAVLAWLVPASADFLRGGWLLEGSLTPIDQKSAELDLAKAAGLSPARAGFTDPALLTWSAGADDNVVLGSGLYFSASRLLTGLGERWALAGYTEAPSAGAALAEALDCTGLGGALTAAGADQALAFDDCTATCLAELCRAAAARIWLRGREATSTTPTELAITAAGAARVGDAAELSGIEGSWVGELRGATVGKGATGGALSATSLESP